MQQINVLEYLENTVKKVPDKIAFADDNVQLSFAQISNISRAIGSYLYNNGCYGKPVVVFMEKCPQEIAAFWGCTYSGAIYVPIDAEMPRFRIQLILENLKADMMIVDKTTKELAKDFEFSGTVALYDDAAATEIDEDALQSVRDRHLDTNPLYITFTSGSTGIPKGVIACHRCVIDYIESLSDVIGFNENTRFANQTPLYMDASMKELYPTIKFGATTWLVPKQLFMFPVKLVEFLNEHEVNTICWVVSALTIVSSFRTFEKVKPEFLHTIVFSGEVFPIKQYNMWKEAVPGASFTNLYGQTEVTGVCCYYRIDRDFALDETMPAGRPFKNTEILLINEKNELAAPGESGEVCVRGTCVTLGYFNDPQRTSASFVQNPLNTRYPEIIYRSGDIGRWNERGELEFVSRKDFQIKHMGHRIELGEIEVNVSMLDGVSMACCIYDKVKGKIVLYYTGDLEVKPLVEALKEKLPRYMIPNMVEHLDEMPLTANGKMDRNTLKKRYEEKRAAK
ncbi:MAG: amino acid adenylation domain-containing protein [Clostridia bacterium]|nr:amino acid adenylation domain-containing protein [Clostridia bacterium]